MILQLNLISAYGLSLSIFLFSALYYYIFTIYGSIYTVVLAFLYIFALQAVRVINSLVKAEPGNQKKHRIYVLSSRKLLVYFTLISLVLFSFFAADFGGLSVIFLMGLEGGLRTNLREFSELSLYYIYPAYITIGINEYLYKARKISLLFYCSIVLIIVPMLLLTGAKVNFITAALLVVYIRYMNKRFHVMRVFFLGLAFFLFISFFVNAYAFISGKWIYGNEIASIFDIFDLNIFSDTLTYFFNYITSGYASFGYYVLNLDQRYGDCGVVTVFCKISDLLLGTDILSGNRFFEFVIIGDIRTNVFSWLNDIYILLGATGLIFIGVFMPVMLVILDRIVSREDLLSSLLGAVFFYSIVLSFSWFKILDPTNILVILLFLIGRLFRIEFR